MVAGEKHMSLREPLARAKGHGSAKEGTHHFIMQRLTSVALLALIPWFLISLMNHIEDDYVALVAWIKEPITSITSILFIVTLFYHLWLGLQVVVEDYVHTGTRRYPTLIIIKFACFIAAFTGIFALLKIAFGA